MEYTDESDDLEKDLIQLLYSSPDSATMLRKIAQKCGDGLGVDTCVILADIEMLETAQVGFWHRDRSDDIIIEQLLSRRELNLILTNEPPTSADALAEFLQVQRVLGMRTEFQEVVNGLILLGKVTPQAWTLDEQNKLSQISKLVSIACTIARSQKENRNSERESNTMLSLINFSRGASIPDIMRRLYDLTRQQLEQQRHLLDQERQLNEKKNDIIAAISDKARNPLASMNLAIQLLSDPNRQLPPQTQENYWNILKQEWTNLNELITSIVTLDQIESKEITLDLQPIVLTTLVQRIASTFREQWRQGRKPLNLELDPSNFEILLFSDPQHLEKVLKELLTNAGHFSVAGQTVLMSSDRAFLNEREAVRITITNTGFGIPLEEQESIYQPFYRGKEVIDKKIPGTGLGLAVTRGLIELLGGSIEVTSEAIEGSDHYLTSFSVILPLNPDSNIH